MVAWRREIEQRLEDGGISSSFKTNISYSCVTILWIFINLLVHANALIPAESFDEWLVKVAEAPYPEDIVRNIATRHGLEVVRPISPEHLPGYFHVRAKKGKWKVREVTRVLELSQLVSDVAFQIPHLTDLRSFSYPAKSTARHRYLQSPHCQCRTVSSQQDDEISRDVFEAMNGKRVNLSERLRFNDFRWPCQWQLYNCGQNGSPNDYDMDVVSVWNKGITGKGIVVAIVDDGVDYRHPEIWPNYDPVASFDFVEFPDYDGPLPYYFKPHGTKCAGVVGMAANNRMCGVGIVYDVKLAALRIMGTGSTYLREASGLIHKSNYIDIYSNSWGPSDSGKLFRKPEGITLKALEAGSNKGRNGKGNLYTFASGNGGLNDDHCGADGFSCSIYTISIGASTPSGKYTGYSEPCTCVMLTIPGTDFHTNGHTDWMIAPTLFNMCGYRFEGTSATTPLASGVLAMMLQANPSLTWRDVQYLIARTAIVVDPDHLEWSINGAGYHVNPYYGFGVLNALQIVEAAEHWENVDVQQRCALVFPSPYRAIPAGRKLILSARTNGCMNTDNQVLKLEHIQVILSYYVKCRGDISIRLRSPCGTISPIMNTRSRDDLTLVVDYPFMSVFHWGEDPRGMWVLEIIDNKGTVSSCYRPSHEQSAGHIFKYELVLWGVKENSRREMKAPVCNREILHSYLNHKAPKDKHFRKLISKERATTRSIIYNEFLNDFSIKIQVLAKSQLQGKPPGPHKVRPYSIAFEYAVDAKWRKTFPSLEDKVSILADYVLEGRSPNSLMNPRDFWAVRWLLAERLQRASRHKNDDGDVEIRDDVGTIAMMLKNIRLGAIGVFPSNHDAKMIITNLAAIWNDSA